jgi:uncharacterized protein (TIGR03437 family)
MNGMIERIRIRFFGYLLLVFAIFSARPSEGVNLPVGAGYSASSSVVRVAPGQVITVFTRNIEARLVRPVVASKLPLPLSLNGISLTMKQTANPETMPVPMFAIFQFDACQGLTSVPCITTGITVQIPYELVLSSPVAFPAIGNIATLTVAENGVSGEPLVLVPLPNQIHVVDLCDITSFAPNPIPCPAPVVTHADGNLVTSSNPARSGEILILYAVGLGRTNPQVSSGVSTPMPAPTSVASVNFDFSINTPPKFPMNVQPDQPLFVGLTPGFASLYQVNFRVPPVPVGTFSCGGTVLSNLTVILSGSSSFDGAPLCVMPSP